MADFANGKIQAFVGPTELGAPDDLERVIVDFINGARLTLDIAVQELDSEPIAQAVLDARWKRGVKVRMFLEQDYLKRDRLPSARPQMDETEEEALDRAQWTEDRRPKDAKTNRDILTACLRSDVDVKADYNPKIFHQKFIIRDYRRSETQTSAILTGSTNFTHTGTHRNLNHVIIFHDYRVCKLYKEEFNQIRSGVFGKLGGRREKPRKTVNIKTGDNKGVPVRVLFAPDDLPELEIVKQMLKCSERLDFAIFTFSKSSGIDDAMKTLRAADRSVRGVFDPVQGKQDWSALPWLHNIGIKCYFPDKGEMPGFGKLHHKLMVVDSDIVIAGSMNYTSPANELNDENIFVLGNPYDLDPSEGGPVDHDACAAIADYFRGEIDRIVTLSREFVPS